MKKMPSAHRIETTRIDIKLIHKNPDNPRQISGDAFDKLVKSLQDFPEMMDLRPVVVNKQMMILGGNMRYEAALKAGWKDIPVIIAKGLTKAQEREFTIKDNVSGGDWNWDELANAWDADLLKEWGMTLPDDWGGKQEAVEDDYEIPDEIQTDIKLGDLFQIGQHRLLCGDSGNSEDVAKLMDGALADLCVTDPPYNTGMNGNLKNAKAWLSQMFNDSLSPEKWKSLITGAFTNIYTFTKGECAIYVFIDWRKVGEVKTMLENIVNVKNVIVWDKGVHGLGSDYKSTYENIIVGKKGKPKINNRYGLDYQDIWRVQRVMGRDPDHATKKPIEILTKPILHASKEDDIVLDLFLGSGSTMVTAHQLSRKCFGIDNKPIYCQIILDRMKKLDPGIEIKKL